MPGIDLRLAAGAAVLDAGCGEGAESGFSRLRFENLASDPLRYYCVAMK